MHVGWAHGMVTSVALGSHSWSFISKFIPKNGLGAAANASKCQSVKDLSVSEDLFDV